MHLAIVTLLPPVSNSIGQYGYYLSDALARTGKFSNITSLAQIAPDTQQVDSNLPFRVERLWHLNRLTTSLKILHRLKQIKPDLVWYNLGVSTFGRSPLSNVIGLLSPAFSRLMGIPTVVTLHEMIEQADLQTLHVPGGPLATWGAKLIQYISTRADVVCVTLRQHAEYLSQNNSNIQVMHIPHGTFIAPMFLPDSENLEILFFGYIAPFKGLELLLKVFHDLHSHHPLLRLTIAGGEHPRFPGYLKNIKRTYGDDPAIRWLGYIPENELDQVFAHATLVVIPSTATTGSSSVLYRAAAWGRAVVASDLPELRAITNEENLWIEFFSSGDDISLRNTIERLLKDTAQRKAQAHHNYKIIEEHLTLIHTSQAYLQAFELALKITSKNHGKPFHQNIL
jgi:glycosyltransferase involved in cell wall biosynthesis